MADPEYIFVASGTTNTAPDSNVDVYINGITLGWEIQDNLYGDKLPIIPKESRVEHGKILYRLKIKVTLHSLGTNRPVAGKSVAIRSNRAGDTVKMTPSVSDASGSMMVTLETREPGELRLSLANTDITSNPLSITLGEAWYESTFLITGYHVCKESDFSGDLVLAAGVNDRHRNDFLYGARGVVMQGTGMALNGRYIRPTAVNTHWALNAHHHPDHLEDPSAVIFSYSDGVHGSFGDVSANHSIAVDPTVILPRAQVEIDAVGKRHADDKGSQVNGYHIDNFVGIGKAVQDAWDAGPINETQRKVKFLGVS